MNAAATVTMRYGSDFYNFARMSKKSGTSIVPIVQADVSTISRKVYRETGSPSLDILSTTVIPVSQISDTLQTGDVWDVDDEGYNFEDFVSYTVFQRAGKYTIFYEIVLLNTHVMTAQFSYFIPSAPTVQANNP